MACLRCVFNWVQTFLESSVFFDGNKFVVLLSGFQKKTQKTPKSEIAHAVKLMNDYYNEKNEENG